MVLELTEIKKRKKSNERKRDIPIVECYELGISFDLSVAGSCCCSSFSLTLCVSFTGRDFCEKLPENEEDEFIISLILCVCVWFFHYYFAAACFCYLFTGDCSNNCVPLMDLTWLTIRIMKAIFFWHKLIQIQSFSFGLFHFDHLTGEETNQKKKTTHKIKK